MGFIVSIILCFFSLYIYVICHNKKIGEIGFPYFSFSINVFHNNVINIHGRVVISLGYECLKCDFLDSA